MVALIISLSLIGLAFLRELYYVPKKRRREEARCLELSQKFLSEQYKLPKSRVVLTTKGGKTFKSGLFQPTAEINYVFGPSVDYRTSSFWAQEVIEAVFKCGYYHDYINLQYVPVCEIEEMSVVQEET